MAVKLLLVLALAGAVVNGLAAARSEPPLLIDASHPPLDAAH